MSSLVRPSLTTTDIRYLLALLGDEGTRAELGDAAPPTLPAQGHSQEAQRYWKRVLKHAGKAAVLKAMTALARRALPTYQSATHGASNQHDRIVPVEKGMRQLSETLAAVESWVPCPCKTHREQVLKRERDWSSLALGHHAAARSVVELVRRTWSTALAPQRFEREAMTGLSAASVAIPSTEVDMLVRTKLREALRAPQSPG